MESKKILTAAVAFTALLSAFGCSENKTSVVAEPETVNTNIDPHSIVFEWQNLYQDKLKEFASSSAYSAANSRFDIYDINQDGTPELILSPNTTADSVCEVYTYKDGLEKFADIGTYGVFRFIPASGCLGYEYVGDGFVYGEYRSMNDGFDTPAFTFYNNVASAASGAVIRYEINGEEVSLIEYDEAMKPYSDSASVSIGRKYTFGEKSIDYALHCSASWGAVLSNIQKNAYKKILTDIISNSPENDAAFEIADLDGNNVPELIVSTGIADNSDCRIYFLNEAEVCDLGSSCGQKGVFSFDVEKSVIFSAEGAETKCLSMKEEDISKFKQSDSVMECGRTFLLTNDSVNFAFQ